MSWEGTTAISSSSSSTISCGLRSPLFFSFSSPQSLTLDSPRYCRHPSSSSSSFHLFFCLDLLFSCSLLLHGTTALFCYCPNWNWLLVRSASNSHWYVVQISCICHLFLRDGFILRTIFHSRLPGVLCTYVSVAEANGWVDWGLVTENRYNIYGHLRAARDSTRLDSV